MIVKCGNLDWLLLTKRPERISECWPCEWWDKPRENVWLGVSAEDQERWDERVPTLLNIPAKVRFVSVEPMLEPIEFSDVTKRSDGVAQLGRKAMSGIDWIILGGESGPKARPCNIEWIRGGVRQCREASVVCFVKQLGARCVTDDSSDPHFHAGQAMVSNPKGGDPAEWPEDLRIRQWPQHYP